MSDIVAVGGDLDPKTLISAYRQGIFPWPMPEHPLVWFCPKVRALLEFSKIHIGRSLAKEIRKQKFRFTVNCEFEKVIDHCREIRKHETWITPEMQKAYIELHRLGYAHSFEVWNLKEELVGGLYGVGIDGFFAGESMFHLENNTSKLAILYASQKLLKTHVHWIDIQMMTPHMKALGARSIKREPFLHLLEKTRQSYLSNQKMNPKLNLTPSERAETLVLQSTADHLSK